jgi:uncharacterized protein (TIGR02246 family)
VAAAPRFAAAVVAALALVAASGCGVVQVFGCPERPEAVAAAARRLIAANNDGDVDAVLAGYSEDVVWMPPAGPPLRGKAAIRPRYEQTFATYHLSFEIDIEEAAAEGDIGFARGSTRGTRTPRSGGESLAVHDKFLALTRCERGQWLVTHLVWSPAAP